MHATTGAWRPTPTQSTCLYYCHGNEASKCVCFNSPGRVAQLGARSASVPKVLGSNPAFPRHTLRARSLPV